MDAVSPIIVFVLLAGSALWAFFRVRESGGIKGAMFGARIQRTIGEVEAVPRGSVKSALRVHVLGEGPDAAVGVELTAKSFASFQMMPITLSPERARDLASFLLEASKAEADA